MTDTATFAGLAINGSVVQTDMHYKPQRSQEEFDAILQAVLNDPAVAEIAWTQYTPYFNDGDPCVFGARCYSYDPETQKENFITLVDGRMLADTLRDSDGQYPFGIKGTVWRDGKYQTIEYEGADEDRYDRTVALVKAISGGEFDQALLKLFGDHAIIKIVKDDGIYIDCYHHD